MLYRLITCKVRYFKPLFVIILMIMAYRYEKQIFPLDGCVFDVTDAINSANVFTQEYCFEAHSIEVNNHIF